MPVEIAPTLATVTFALATLLSARFFYIRIFGDDD
jgi:hypothetical protein